MACWLTEWPHGNTLNKDATQPWSMFVVVIVFDVHIRTTLFDELY